MKILGIAHSHPDPSAALCIDGNVVSFVDEERLTRVKHAAGEFPIHSIDYVLEEGGITIDQVDYIAQAWDCKKYDNGIISEHYDRLNEVYPTEEIDIAYQKKHLQNFRSARQTEIILTNLRRRYGDMEFPKVHFMNHHFSHACTAYFYSGMQEALTLVVDGSGEEITTSWWLGKNSELTLLYEIKVPHSLGWIYSAFTEYLGFQAYDGEYKVMGLAAYGESNKDLDSKMSRLVRYDDKGGFEVDPMILVRGKRRHSYFYPDVLAEFMGRQPRTKDSPIEQWHKDCAYSLQRTLERIIANSVAHWVEQIGIRNLCISGGVGLNVKMNGRIFSDKLVDDLFVFPICSDAGQSIGAAMALHDQSSKSDVKQLNHLYWGPEFSNKEIEDVLIDCKLSFSQEKSIESKVATLISQGKIVGWFQGRMEGGPRALGSRSILADPRDVQSRDKVNGVIKYRELWRPFCPSMTEEAARKYFKRYTRSPFMIITFEANEQMAREVPAVVHVDGTARPQIVDSECNPRYYNLLKEFEKLTGIAVVLNTSFNVKGEPIVCTPQDAIRTFYATGLDALAIGDFLVTKVPMKNTE